MAGSLQAEVVARLRMEFHKKVVRVLAEVLLEEHLTQVIQLRQRQIQAVVLVEVLQVLVILVLVVQALFVLRYLHQFIQAQ